MPSPGSAGEELQYKETHMCHRGSVSVCPVNSMELYLRSAGQLGLLVLFCTLLSARQSGSTFVPGRCLCPRTQLRVRGQLKELSVYPKSPSCDKVTVIVTLKNNEAICLSPEGQMGKQLTRCWNRVHKLGRDVKLCLRRNRRRTKGLRQRSRHRNQGQNQNGSVSQSQ